MYVVRSPRNGAPVEECHKDELHGLIWFPVTDAFEVQERIRVGVL